MYCKDYNRDEIVMIDVEASSFSKDSYPIEIAWVSLSNEEDSFLIKTNEVEEWTDWSSESEKVHGIDRQQLDMSGISIYEAAQRLNSQLNGCIVLSDCADSDSFWIDKLFSASSTTREFILMDIYDFAVNNGVRNAMSFIFEKNKQEIAHRALADCRQNLDICKKMGIFKSMFTEG